VIKLLFGRFSVAVKAMEVTGTLLATVSLLRAMFKHAGAWHIALIALTLVLYALIRYCTTVRWYQDAPRYAGIELQFRKALVPTGYAMSLCFALYLLSGSIIFPALCAFMLAVIAHVNAILLYFHRRDKDPTPVNFYSNGMFLSAHSPESAIQKR
jgi:hypothetical protein